MAKKIVSGCVAILAVVFTTKIVLSLMSEEGIALILGAFVGILITAPCAAICTYLFMKQERHAALPPQNQPAQWWAISQELNRQLIALQEQERRVADNAPIDTTWRPYR